MYGPVREAIHGLPRVLEGSNLIEWINGVQHRANGLRIGFFQLILNSREEGLGFRLQTNDPTLAGHENPVLRPRNGASSGRDNEAIRAGGVAQCLRFKHTKSGLTLLLKNEGNS